MRSLRPATRALQAVLALGLLTAVAAGCQSRPMPFGLNPIQRLYIADVAIQARGEATDPEALQAMNTAMDSLARFGDLGVYLSSVYTITVDPRLTLQTTSERTIPSAEQIDEQVFNATGDVATRKVSRVPLFYLDDAVITYRVPGYSEAELGTKTINLNYAMKSNSATLDNIRVGIPQVIARALWDRPAETPPALGEATITIRGRDLDPILSEDARKVEVSRTFPVRYTYGTTLLGEAAANQTPLVVPQPAIFGTPGPSAAPSAAASAAP